MLVGATWPVIRADTVRAVRDLGFATVGFLLLYTAPDQYPASTSIHVATKWGWWRCGSTLGIVSMSRSVARSGIVTACQRFA